MRGEATDGSVFNLAALRRGEMDMAIVQSDWQYHAYKGTARFRDEGPFKDLRSVFGLHGEPFTVVARADAGIGTFQDLKGKRVNIGPEGSGGRIMLDTVLKAFSWTVRDFALASELPATGAGRRPVRQPRRCHRPGRRPPQRRRSGGRIRVLHSAGSGLRHAPSSA